MPSANTGSNSQRGSAADQRPALMQTTPCFGLAILASLALGLLLITQAVAAVETWQHAPPLPIGNHLNDIVYNDGMYIAVGTGGTILTSSDGVAWTQRASGISDDLHHVAAASSSIAAIADHGLTLISDDGITWAAGGSLPYERVYELVRAPSLLVAVAWDGQSHVLTSADGVAWTETAVIDTSVRDLIWTGSELVAVGDDVLASNDAVTWQVRGSGAYFFQNHVASGGLKLVAATNSYISWSDNGGGTWHAPTTFPDQSISCTDLLWTGSEFLAVGREYHQRTPTSSYLGDTLVYRSEDGATWSDLGIPDTHVLLAGTSNGENCVFVGQWGVIEDWAETSGWSTAEPGRITGLRSVASSGDLFVAVGSEGFVATSSDGLAWEPHEVPYDGYLRDVIWVTPQTGAQPSPGYFMAVGFRIDPYTGVVATSADGVTWQIDEVATEHELYLSGIVATNDGFVAAGIETNSGAFVSLLSSDGTSWTYHVPNGLGGGYAPKITWNGATLIAASGWLSLYASNDGVTWADVTPELTIPSPLFRDVAWNGTEFMAVAEGLLWGGVALASPDGTGWNLIADELPLAPQAIESIGDRFVTVGDPNWARLPEVPFPIISLAADGTRYWPDVSALHEGDWQGVAQSGDRLVAVDYSGKLAHADLVVPGPGPTISGPTALCVGETVTLSAAAGFTDYEWSTGEQTQAITVQPTGTIAYWVRAENDQNQSITSPLHTVVVYELPEPLISGRTQICLGEVVTLDAGAGHASYLWSTGQTTRTISVSPTVTTTYSVTVTNDGGCQGTSLDHRVEIAGCSVVVYTDGFESGDLSAWTMAVP